MNDAARAMFDLDGKVIADVEEVSLSARRKIVLRAPGAWLQVADSAQPPPTQPATTRPPWSMTALEAVLAETEPSVSTTVAIAKGLRSVRNC